MKKIFTPVRLLAFAGILASTALVYSYASAQTDDKDKKKTKIEKKIEIVDENGQKKVTVTTIENGNKKIETFTGEEAEAYLRKEHGGNKGNFHMSFDFDMDTLLGKNSFDFNIDGFGEEFEKGMQEMMEELKKEGAQMQFDFKEMFKDMDSAFSGNNFKAYSFNFDHDFKNLDSILKNLNFDIHIEADDEAVNGNEPRKKRIIVAHSVVIEDMDKKKNAEKDLNITDLSFYPNPNGGNFNLRYKSESIDMIDISVVDLNGKTVYNERVSATGTIIRNIELNEPSGTYILNLKQGKKHVSKKLIIK
jgi:Secretion system C-terminal sorting domain